MNRPDTTTRFLFVRHGETAWDRDSRFRGRADVPLSDEGRHQARLVGARVARQPVSAVYASPLSRALETARAIAGHHGLDPLPCDALVDVDYGDWQGRTPDEIAAEDPAAYAYWLAQPSRASIPGGEPVADVRARVAWLVNDVASRRPGETVVLVSHDMVGRALMTAILGLPLDAIRRIAQQHAALNAFERRSDRFVVHAINDTGHLGPLEGEHHDATDLPPATRRDRVLSGASLSLTT